MAVGREFDRADEMQLADGAAALAAGDRIGLGAIRDVALVDFDEVFEQRTIGIDHGAAQLLQHEPGGLVGAESELRLELQRGYAVGVAGDGVDGLEPGQQVEMAAMEDGAGGDGCLAAAGGAFVGEALGGQLPGFLTFAGGADEAVRPAFFEEEASAGRIVGEPLVEGGSRHWAVVFPAARHENEFRTSARASSRVGAIYWATGLKGISR